MFPGRRCRTQLLFSQPLQDLRFEFMVGARGVRGHGEKIHGLGGLAEVFQAIRASPLNVLADIEASAPGNCAEQVKLVEFL
jgi:hypothetical protein